MWNLKYNVNKLMHETDSQAYRTDLWLSSACVWGGCGRGVNWEFESGRCKLLHIEWINKKVQMYSIGNYSQHPVINHSEEE